MNPGGVRGGSPFQLGTFFSCFVSQGGKWLSFGYVSLGLGKQLNAAQVIQALVSLVLIYIKIYYIY